MTSLIGHDESARACTHTHIICLKRWQWWLRYTLLCDFTDGVWKDIRTLRLLNLSSIGSDNSLAPNRRQATITVFCGGQHTEAYTKWPAFADDIFKCIFVNENQCIFFIEISLKFLRIQSIWWRFDTEQATKVVPICWRIYASLALDELITKQWASYQIRKIAGAHAPGIPGAFSPPPRVSDPDMHHGTCVTHVP